MGLEKETGNTATKPKEDYLTKIAARAEKVVYPLNRVLHLISSSVLFIMMVLTASDVAGRYFFNRPITGTYELTGLFLSLVIFLSLGMTQLKRGHIEIDFLTNKMPMKARESLHAVVSSILAALLLVTTWYMVDYTIRVGLSGETSGDLRVPLFLFIAFAVLGVFSFTLTILLEVFQSMIKVVHADES